MKKVLLFSAVLFLGWFCACDLCAQTCQPNPACKATCSAAKADMKSGAATTGMQTGVPVAAVNQPGAGLQKVSLKAECDPTKCDPSNCDPTKCDPTKCDLSKCMPANCTAPKAKDTRI